MTVPTFLPSTLASPDERDLIAAMNDRLTAVGGANRNHGAYYEGTFTAETFGFSIPPSMRNLAVIAGWGGTVVDVLEERLDWLGWRADQNAFGLDEVYASNQLGIESGYAHLDALIYGTSFLAVGSGRDGEPSPLVTVQSPQTMTALMDPRQRRVEAAASFTYDDVGNEASVTLYRPDETVTFDYSSGAPRVVDRDLHRLGRVPVVQMRNRVRASDSTGRSEITSAVRYYTDAAVRTMLGMEVHREFYQAPQRWAMNVDPDQFEDESGRKVSPWQSVMGRVWAIPANEEGEAAPSVGQFTPASPTPYIDQVRNLATMLAAEAGIPSAYLGFATDNPASADAIRAGEARLIKRAERRMASFGQAWLEIGRLALLVRDGEIPADYDAQVSLHWRDAATPTRAAAADEAAKLIGAGVLPADSAVTLDRVGLTPDEQKQVRNDVRRSQGRAALDQILAVAPADPQVTDGAAG